MSKEQNQCECGNELSTIAMGHPSGVKAGDKMCQKCNRVYLISPTQQEGQSVGIFENKGGSFPFPQQEVEKCKHKSSRYLNTSELKICNDCSERFTASPEEAQEKKVCNQCELEGNSGICDRKDCRNYSSSDWKKDCTMKAGECQSDAVVVPVNIVSMLIESAREEAEQYTYDEDEVILQENKAFDLGKATGRTEERARLIALAEGMKAGVSELFPSTDVKNPTDELAQMVIYKEGHKGALSEFTTKAQHE